MQVCRTNKPDGFRVSWISPLRMADGSFQECRSFRMFLGASHGGLRLAARASLRWLWVMSRKWGDGNAWEEIV